MALILILLTLSLSAGPLDQVPVGQWYEIPNSHLSSVKPAGWSANEIDPWSGGAFDSKRNRLIVWGGGHSDYSGNEIYVFDLATLKWSRLTNPASDVSGGMGTGEYPLANGLIQPRSRHTYEYIEYLASIDRFCSFGFASPYPDGGPGGDRMHCFDFNTNKWERRMPTPGWGLGALSAYDPLTGHGWVKGTDSHSYLAEFIPEQGTVGAWVARSASSNDFMYQYALTMELDPLRRKLVAVGGGSVYTWDIGAAGNLQHQAVNTNGATGIIGTKNPGLAYDPVSQELVAWGSGQSVYSLNTQTLLWTQHSAGGANPGSPAQWGTYGRFRYSPRSNLFVVVNSIDQNVFVYRHTPGTGTGVEESAYGGQGQRASDKGQMVVSPNPITSAATVSLNGEAMGAGFLEIFSAAGRLVARSPVEAGSRGIVWSAGALSPGIYLARLSMGNQIYLTKFIRIE